MISVIIPLYNKEPIIENTLKSVLSQDYDDFEVIVVNDGSTDRSAEIVREIKDTRVCLIDQMNGGPSAARNTGVCNANGNWVIFLDADDELMKDALSLLANLAQQHSDADIIDCGQQIKTSQGIRYMPHSLNGYSRNPMKDWYFRRISPGSNHSLFKKSFALQFPYNPQLRRFEDADLLIRMLPCAMVYSSIMPISIVNTEYSAASSVRRNITEDYLGHLSLQGKSFWQKMCIYRTFLEERNNYPKDCRKLYPSWYYRYDFLLLYKILTKLQCYWNNTKYKNHDIDVFL